MSEWGYQEMRASLQFEHMITICRTSSEPMDNESVLQCSHAYTEHLPRKHATVCFWFLLKPLGPNQTPGNNWFPLPCNLIIWSTKGAQAMRGSQNTHVDITAHVAEIFRHTLPRSNGISQITPEHTLNTCSVLVEGFGAHRASERKLDICHLKILMETSSQSIQNYTKSFPRL